MAQLLPDAINDLFRYFCRYLMPSYKEHLTKLSASLLLFLKVDPALYFTQIVHSRWAAISPTPGKLEFIGIPHLS